MKSKFVMFLSALFITPIIFLTAGHSEAFVALQPIGSNPISGQVRFAAKKEGLHIYGYIEGLTPGSHGLHIHEKGECLLSPAVSETAHIEDLGSVTADEDGIADFQFVNSKVSLEGANSIIGKTLIILSGEKEGEQAKVACGPILEQI